MVSAPQPDWTVTPEGLTHHELEHRRTPIHYWTGGVPTGPAVAMLHGAWMDHRMFNAQLPVLADSHRVLVWDAPGHGLSQPLVLTAPTIDDYVDEFVAVLDDAGIERAIVMGQSMGGLIAQHLIRRHPQRVAALVVIDSTPIAFRRSAFELLALRAVARSFGWWPQGYLRRVTAKSTALTEDVRAYALDAVSNIDRRTLVTIYQAVATAIRRAGFPDFGIEVPFLLAHGQHDRTGTIAKDGPRWAATDPRIDYVVVPEAGHNANQDNPQAFNSALIRFLERLG